MFGRRERCPILNLLRQPGAGWALLTTVYLSSAIVSVYLALTMSVWWPLILITGSVLGATLCVTAAFRSARKPKTIHQDEWPAPEETRQDLFR
jgi:hypothetical protein